MKLRKRGLISVALLIPIALMLMPSMHASATGIAPSLGAASNFAILGVSKVTNNGPTTVTGDLGIYPNVASSVTGFTFSSPPGLGVVNPPGTVHTADITAQTAQVDTLYAFNSLTSQSCDVDYGTAQDLSGLTLAPGVYCAGSFTLGAAQPLTLDAGGDPNAVWIFKARSVTTSDNSQVTVLNDPLKTAHCRVFWPAAFNGVSRPLVTLGSSSTFLGTIIAEAGDINIGKGAHLRGRALALLNTSPGIGTVSTDASTVDSSSCVLCPPETTVTVTKTEVRTMTESATFTVIQPVGTATVTETQGAVTESATVTQTQCTECPVTQTVTVTQTSPPTSSTTTSPTTPWVVVTTTSTTTQTTTTTQQSGSPGLNFPFAVIGIGAGVAALGVGVAVAASRPLGGCYYCRKHNVPVWSFSGRFWCPVDSRYLSRIEVAFYPLRHSRSPLGWLRRLLW